MLASIREIPARNRLLSQENKRQGSCQEFPVAPPPRQAIRKTNGFMVQFDEEHLEEPVKGVRFVVNEAGPLTDVIISLKTNPGLLDDIYGQSLARKRSAEPRESLASVKRKLPDRGARRRS